MINLRTICRPHTVFSSLMCCNRHHLHQAPSRIRVFFRNPNFRPSLFAPWFDLSTDLSRKVPWFRANQRRTVVRASNWSDQKSPYETLVYNGKGALEEGETAEARFIKIQAAYELLIDVERRRQYDMDNRVNPMKASQAWMEWLIKKRKAWDQRGDMAVAAWAQQQQRELHLRVRRLYRSKIDRVEERKILVKEKKASMEQFSNTLKRHTLVLKKRDLMRKKAEEEKKKVINQLLAAEGLELDTEDESQ